MFVGETIAAQSHVTVNRELCGTCGACVALCPKNVLFLLNTYLYIDVAQCTACGRCVRACPVQALAIAQPAEAEQG